MFSLEKKIPLQPHEWWGDIHSALSRLSFGGRDKRDSEPDKIGWKNAVAIYLCVFCNVAEDFFPRAMPVQLRPTQVADFSRAYNDDTLGETGVPWRVLQ